jgi:MFS family permease
MWNRGFVLSLLANFTYWVCFFFHIALYPLFLDRQGLDSTTLSDVLAVAAFGALVGRVVSGWAIDQWGAKPFIAFGGFTMAVLSPLMVMTNHLALLYLSRIILGFGIGIFTNATLAHITYISPPEIRGRAVSWWGVMNNFANAIVPPLAVGLMLVSSFPVAFTLGAVFALAAGVIGLFLPRANSKPTPNPAGNFHAPILPYTEVGEPVLPIRSPFRVLVRPAIFPGIVAGAIGFSLAAFISFAPLIAEQSGMENPGLYLTVYAIANIIGQFTSGPISDRKGRPWVILPGFVLAALAMGLLGVTPQVGLLIPFVFGLGTGSGIPGILAWAVDLVKVEEQALASSTVLVMWEIFVFAGIAFQGRMMDAGQGDAGFRTMAGVIFAAMGLYLAYRWYMRRNLIPQVVQL